MKLLFVLVICLIALLGKTTAINCAEGQKTCRVILRNRKESDQCYNPQTHHCISNMLCPKSTNARCGDSCFSTSKIDGHVCFEDFFLCPSQKYNSICLSSCYNPEEFRCVNGSLQSL